MSASGTRAPASTASTDLPPATRTAQAALFAGTPKSHVDTTSGLFTEEAAPVALASSGAVSPAAPRKKRLVTIRVYYADGTGAGTVRGWICFTSSVLANAAR